MGDIKVGDVVSHPSGCNTNVIAIHPQEIQDIYEVTFIDGAKTRVTGEHLWYFWKSSCKSKQEKKSNKGKIWTTIMLKDYLDKIYTKKRKYYPIIPLSKPTQFTKPTNHKNKIHPYIIGSLIGDGGLTAGVTFTSADKEIVDKISELLTFDNIVQKQKNDYGYCIKNKNHLTNLKGYPINPFKEELKKIGLMYKRSYEKRIPKYLLTSTIEERFELLRGLMDTDGTVGQKGDCSYCSVSFDLIKDVQYLVRSLGGRARIRKKKTNQGLGYAFNLHVQIENTKNLFHLTRKKERCIQYNGGVSEVGRRMIKIELVGKEEAQCITVDNPDGLYITDDFIITHNSILGCFWVINQSLNYPGTAWVIGRRELSNLKKTTLLSFFQVINLLGLKAQDYFILNSQTNIIQFHNGSRIFLMDMSYQPSDPLYTRFGGLELTGAFIDESNENQEQSIEIIKTRLGRCKNIEYNLIPKLLETFNPSKNHVYTRYYKPYKDKRLPKHVCFIPALATDNPHLLDKKGFSVYIEQLKNADKITKERLLYGNFEYDEDLSKLFNYDAILGIFNDQFLRGNINENYLTCDVARGGDDKTIIIHWSKLFMMRIWINPILVNGKIIRSLTGITKTNQIEDSMNFLAEKLTIPRTRQVVDEDGVGGGVVDHLPGVKGFVNNSKAIESEQSKKIHNYANLKSQCWIKLADYVNEGMIGCAEDTELEIKELLIQDLEQIKLKDFDKEGPLKVISKEEIKGIIQRSTDIGDAVMMRMIFELREPYKPYIA